MLRFLSILVQLRIPGIIVSNCIQTPECFIYSFSGIWMFYIMISQIKKKEKFFFFVFFYHPSFSYFVLFCFLFWLEVSVKFWISVLNFRVFSFQSSHLEWHFTISHYSSEKGHATELSLHPTTEEGWCLDFTWVWGWAVSWWLGGSSGCHYTHLAKVTLGKLLNFFSLILLWE